MQFLVFGRGSLQFVKAMNSVALASQSFLTVDSVGCEAAFEHRAAGSALIDSSENVRPLHIQDHPNFTH